MRRNGSSAFARRASLLPSTILVALTAAVCLPGCGKGPLKNKVMGKVTLNGKPVAGMVVFLGADGKEIPTPLTSGGSYTIANLPQGEARVMVRGAVAASARSSPRRSTRAADFMPALPDPDGVSPPARYAFPNNGLKYLVTDGEQTFDIPLKP